MSNDTPAALQSAATDEVEQRAQWEAFEFSVPEPGIVRAENHSHEDPEEHTYDVKVRHGSAVSCECPGDKYHDGPCKHRVAVEDQAAVLGAATEEVARDVRARTDGGTDAIVVAGDDGEILDEDPTYTYHYEPAEQGGQRYVRCERCGAECIPANPDRLAHFDGCPEGR
jgi:hypothetical protein